MIQSVPGMYHTSTRPCITRVPGIIAWVPGMYPMSIRPCIPVVPGHVSNQYRIVCLTNTGWYSTPISLPHSTPLYTMYRPTRLWRVPFDDMTYRDHQHLILPAHSSAICLICPGHSSPLQTRFSLFIMSYIVHCYTTIYTINHRPIRLHQVHTLNRPTRLHCTPDSLFIMT